MIDEKPQSQERIVEQSVDFLVPGMELARDILNDNGSILATSKTVINKSLIQKLKNWNIRKISIIAETTTNPITDPKIQKFFHKHNQSIVVVQKAFDNIRQTQEIPLETFKTTSNGIIENISESGNIIDQLYNLPPCDDYTFRHSVNVSTIVTLIATWLKFPQENIIAIALAGLLHDVGKSQLPEELLNKSSSLSPSDYELYKTHTTLGYELVKKEPGIAQSVLAGILDHHEREDGSGYPKQLTSDDIHPYAKIIAIADRFDESLRISSENPGILSPYLSLEKLWDEIHCLDAKITIIFIQNMMNFLSGNIVCLTNGQQGRVVFVNKDKPSCSIIQQEDGTVIDLSERADLSIHYVIR